jgi:hypothetical protein
VSHPQGAAPLGTGWAHHWERSSAQYWHGAQSHARAGTRARHQGRCWEELRVQHLGEALGAELAISLGPELGSTGLVLGEPLVRSSERN